jgi:hypothetical protein
MSRDGAQTRTRKGTKATQGINQDVTVLARANAAALSFVGPGSASPCSYPEHRYSDWRGADPPAGSRATCGVCHPPVAFFDTEIVRRPTDDPAVKDRLRRCAPSRDNPDEIRALMHPGARPATSDTQQTEGTS